MPDKLPSLNVSVTIPDWYRGFAHTLMAMAEDVDEAAGYRVIDPEFCVKCCAQLMLAAARFRVVNDHEE